MGLLESLAEVTKKFFATGQIFPPKRDDAFAVSKAAPFDGGD